MTLKYWSKLESATDITSPQIGPAGVVDGSPTYATCKFNNGIYIDQDDEAYHFPNNPTTITGDKGVIEFWFKPDFNLVNGVPADSAHHIFVYYDPAGDGYMWVYIVSTGGIKLYRTDDTGTNVQTNDTTTDWTAGDLVHLAFVWDKDAGFDSTKTMANYVNGVETSSVTTALVTLTDDTSDITIGAHGALSSPIDGIMDNLKIFDEGKTNFADRNYEDGVIPAGKPMFFSGGVALG